MAATVVGKTGNDDIDGILWGWKYDHTNLTFSFPTSSAEYSGYAQVNGFEAFSAQQATAVRAILANVASFCGLTFSEVTTAGAQLRFAEADSIDYTDSSSVATHTGNHVPGGSTAEANPPEVGYNGAAPFSPSYAQGDGWFTHNNYDNPRLGSFQYAAGLMHETGHNLGLKHGHVTQAAHGDTFPTLPGDHNSYEYSVMTYHSFVGDTVGGDNALDHPTTYMQDDIAALQYLYGANYNFNSNNTTYTWSPTTGEAFINGVSQGVPQSNCILMTIWDGGGGGDSYDFSNFSTGVTVDLSPGGWSSTGVADQIANLGYDSSGTYHYARGNIANALLFQGNTASLIENATGGTGNDRISGNNGSNFLQGGGGGDTLSGGLGADILYGGADNDLLQGGGDNDLMKGGGGADTLEGGAGVDGVSYSESTAAVSVSLGSGSTYGTGSGGFAEGDRLSGDIENLTGSGYNDTLYGNAAGNSIYGGVGNDLIKGGGGADTLDGGADNDTVSYYFASQGLYINLDTNTVSTGEKLAGIENAVGGFYADTLYGNAGANHLEGEGGDDYLKGAGGADTLDGGAGVDSVSFYLSTVGLSANLATGVVSTGETLVDIENIYGSLYDDTLIGNSLANDLSGSSGSDTVDYSGSNAGVAIDLTAGTGASGTAAGDTLYSIETVIGSNYADSLKGDQYANNLQGGAGADTISGEAGSDTMTGGTGSDVYTVDDAGDRIVELKAGGFDTVNASVSFSLAGQYVENLNLTGRAAIDGTGNSLNNVITGNAGRNHLIGLAGADTLIGGGESDTMEGGADGDTYYVEAVGDKVVEANVAGVDIVMASVGFSLAGQYVENLTLTGAGDINGTGNSLANSLVGNAGENVLDGGTGADTMAGGAGADTYYVRDAGDKVIEANVAGHDTVLSYVSFALTGQYVEQMFLIGSAAIDGTGNSLDNALTGNAAANKLIGLAGADSLNGGAGADTMTGGEDNDVYYVDNVGDKVVEANGEGADTVNSSVTFSLAGQYIEKLVLTGSANSNGTGNSLANILTGNAGDNVLDGGKGADTMAGGLGNDDYYAQSSGDKVIELDGAGNDRVYASVTYSLAGQFIERLRLTGSADINGTGNSLDNLIAGNSGDNILDGGKGSDHIAGGAGRDTFVFSTALSAANVDELIDFSVADDTIRMDHSVFAGLSVGALAASAFYVGTAAHDASDRIVYNNVSGALLFDRDGSAATYAAVQFATLDDHLAVTRADFTVV